MDNMAGCSKEHGKSRPLYEFPLKDNNRGRYASCYWCLNHQNPSILSKPPAAPRPANLGPPPESFDPLTPRQSLSTATQATVPQAAANPASTNQATTAQTNTTQSTVAQQAAPQLSGAQATRVTRSQAAAMETALGRRRSAP
ncbi:hypothetical protein BT63DRAFT_420363 [Microthyrium microscopicum]|uniref:Uncharacterized protein n=1 Tax=Microthyrium microscopicum TaxID=703497 RepID=A0A6A6US37_9PEZI|nr:hypothetical protein BT63DRAFT_420363 [Microthyrium microscopicum]